MELRAEYDIHYAENWTLLLDLKVLAMTFFICLSGRNAY
jgi:lipopolysaccharide/colanic/teichoic acid biosynthesis glycosyltransferase